MVKWPPTRGWKGQIELPGSYVDMPSYILLNGGNLIITFQKSYQKKTEINCCHNSPNFFFLEKSGASNFWGGTMSNVPNVTTTRFLQHKIIRYLPNPVTHHALWTSFILAEFGFPCCSLLLLFTGPGRFTSYCGMFLRMCYEKALELSKAGWQIL